MRPRDDTPTGTTGTSPEALLQAFQGEAMRTFVGRVLLVAHPASPRWRGRVVGWRVRVVARCRWASLQARWLAFRRFDLGLALAPWRGHPIGTAAVICDGINLRFVPGPGRMELLTACPSGHEPHAVPVADAAALAEQFRACLVDRTAPPWGCPPACPGAQTGGHLRAVATPTS